MQFEDYTLSVIWREDWNSWEAGLEEFYALRASGSTREEALLELQRLFRERVIYLEASGKPLPLPGEAAELLHSTSGRIDAQAAMARDFFVRVLGLDYDEVFVSDATRLAEFGDFEGLRRKILDVYATNIGEDVEQPLWLSLETIRRFGTLR